MLAESNQPNLFLNPDTYLNHFSPTDGFEFQMKLNVTTVLLGAALWDALAYLNLDARIIRSSRFNGTIFCFIFSRLFALGHITIVAVRFPTDKVSPQVLYIISGSFYMLSMMTSSFLFLQRVFAVYNGTRRIRIGFSIFWLIVSLSDIIIPLSGSPRNIPGTTINKDSGIGPWVITCAWLSFSFDSAITLAISYKLWLSHRLPNENLSWYHLASSGTLPRLSRSILLGGLQYYLIVVWAVMMVGITQALPSVPQIYKEMFPAIMLFLISTMASRVFRNIRLFDSDNVFTESTWPAVRVDGG